MKKSICQKIIKGILPVLLIGMLLACSNKKEQREQANAVFTKGQELLKKMNL